MEANRTRWWGYGVLAIASLVAALTPRHAWWGQLLFWAAVFSAALTGMYLWATRWGGRG